MGEKRLIATINQLYIFLATVYGGFLIGLLYGAITVVRHISRAGRVATIVWDIIFFIFGTAISLAVVYIANKADLRFYTFLGLAAGFCMYFFGLRYTVAAIYKRFARDKKH